MERKISDTHYIIIDCNPGSPRPNDILKMILLKLEEHDFTEEDALLYNDAIAFDDFILIYSSFGECKYGVYKDKEQLFELSLSKMIDMLTNLYNSRQIRFAEWSPKLF